MSESISTPSLGILPGIEERFSFRNLLFPDVTEPSNLSGFTVKVCASFLGMKHCDLTSKLWFLDYGFGHVFKFTEFHRIICPILV